MSGCRDVWWVLACFHRRAHSPRGGDTEERWRPPAAASPDFCSQSVGTDGPGDCGQAQGGKRALGPRQDAVGLCPWAPALPEWRGGNSGPGWGRGLSRAPGQSILKQLRPRPGAQLPEPRRPPGGRQLLAAQARPEEGPCGRHHLTECHLRKGLGRKAMVSSLQAALPRGLSSQQGSAWRGWGT